MDWLLLSADAPKIAAPAASEGTSMLTVAAILLCVFVLPFALGTGLARMLRLKDMSVRIGTVFFALAFGLAPFVWQYVIGAREQAAYQKAYAAWEAEGKEKGEKEPKRAEPRTWKSAIKLGIDLRGGTNLVFQVRPEEGKTINSEIMDRMVGAVKRRVNPTGTEEVVVRAVGTDRIEVIIPGAEPDEVNRIKDQITRLGSLEFGILASERDPAERNIIDLARNAEDEVRQGNRVVARWRSVAQTDKGEYKLTESEAGDAVTRTKKIDGKDTLQFLVLVEPENQRVTGRYLTRASETFDDAGGPAVAFEFNTRGGFLFSRLTSQNLPRADGTARHLAILLDNKIHSAPTIQETIGSSGRITGRFTRQEVAELINVLNAGALEVPIDPKPISEFSIGPLLAHDVQEKGLRAVYVSSALVVIFMLVYYMAAGAVADFCLLFNIVLILGSMAYIDATFTLPGIAGIVLTIGMAVDANVLIYERMREEQLRGASFRMTVHNGFDKALSAIIDSNVTTLITAAILYMIGTDQIKGFAVTLFIGLVASMFTAVFMGRVVFDVIERKRWLTKLRMLSLIHVPHIDWLAWWKPAVGLSAAIILAGFIALGVRGIDNFDIDFTGGTMATFEFEEPQDLTKVKAALQSSELGSATSVERLTLLGEDPSADVGTRYRVRTKLQDRQDTANPENNLSVRRIISQALTEAGLPLRRVTVEYGEIADYSDPDVKPEGLTQFPDGRAVTLAFSSGMKPTTAQDYFLAALRQQTVEVQGNAEPKYPDPQNLVAVEGVTPAEAEGGEADPDAFKTIRLMTAKEIAQADISAALSAMQERLETEPVFDEINTFDSQIAGDMRNSALMAIGLSLLAIIGYLWFRFERIGWGLAAAAALGHDALVTLGAIPLAAYLAMTPIGPLLGLQDFKIDLGVVASILTIIGFSTNDTIVIFDRIREIRGKNPHLTKEMLNTAVNQTMSRTILTSLTVLIVVVIMYLFGGEGLHTFAFTLIVGVISGTWSTIYMANPVLLWLMNRPTGAPARSTAPAMKTAGAPG